MIKQRILNKLRKALLNILLLASVSFATTSLQANGYDTNKQTLSNTQIECLSKAAYFDAKGETKQGMLAVIHTTLNRVNDPRFPKTICGVVYQKAQYSWTKHNPKVKDHETFKVAKQLAKETLEGKHPDNTNKALYFHANYVSPSWSKRLKCTKVIGGHKFYR